MKVALIRWLVFIFIGLPFQMILMLLYPLVHLYWRFFVYDIHPTLPLVQHENTPLLPKHSSIRDGCFHNNQDDHSALSHFGLFITTEKGAEGMPLLIHSDGRFLRRYNASGLNGNYVSGDAVVNWCFAFAAMEPTAAMIDSLKRAATHYLKNLGSLSFDEPVENVSARCNNFGLNYCPDGYLGLGQPAAAPQFYTNSCLFALAAKYCGFQWKLVFWIHWLLLGGWYWAFSPVIYSKANKLWYVRDTTMKALWVHKRVFGFSWWISKPMTFIAFKIAEVQNDLFFAMLNYPFGTLPEVMSPFFSQMPDARSFDDEKSNIWVRPGIEKIRSLS